MGEIREKLKPLIGKRITIRGNLVDFKDWLRNHRDVGRACISCPEYDGNVLAEHVWVIDVPHWLPYKNNLGEQVEFSAVPKSYNDRDGGKNYCLTGAGDLKLLHQPPALPIPKPVPIVDNEAMPEQEENDPPPNQELVASAVEMLKQARRFVKSCSGLEQAETILTTMQQLTLTSPELLQLVKALKEETI